MAAAQIILDLKGSLVASDIPQAKVKLSDNKSFAKEGLMSLGFKAKDCEDALNRIQEEDLSIEEYITKALKFLK